MSTKPKVLIVDDEEEIAVLFGFLLTHNGFDTDIAYNGKEALDKLTTLAFDYVISDVRMPIMNGAELFNQAQELVKPTPQFIFISGFEDILDDKILKASLAKFTKPVEHELIVQVLTSDMEAKKAGSNEVA